MDNRPNPPLPPNYWGPVTDQGGRYPLPEEAMPWRKPVLPPQTNQPMQAPNPLNPFNANLKQFAKDWVQKPKSMAGDLWNAYSSAAPGLGVGAAAGSFSRGLASIPRMTKIAQAAQAMNHPVFPNVGQGIINAASSPEVVNNVKRLFGQKMIDYLRKVPQDVTLGQMSRPDTMMGRPPLTSQTGPNSMKLEVPKISDYIDYTRNFPKSMQPEVIKTGAKNLPHELGHILDYIAAARRNGGTIPMGPGSSPVRGGNRIEELAKTARQHYPEVDQWAKNTAPEYRRMYQEAQRLSQLLGVNNPRNIPRKDIANESLVEAGATHIYDLMKRRQAAMQARPRFSGPQSGEIPLPADATQKMNELLQRLGKGGGGEFKYNPHDDPLAILDQASNTQYGVKPNYPAPETNRGFGSYGRF